MKKIILAGVALLLASLAGTAVYAGWGCNGGRWGKDTDVTAVRQFQKETLQLRDEMMVKRLELRQEMAKESPDSARIAALKGEMIELRAKIQAAAEKNGLPGCREDCRLLDDDPANDCNGPCGQKKGRGCRNCP